MDTEQVARLLDEPGTHLFKVWQAATSYPLPALRAMLREATAERHAATELETLDAPWWQEWTAILTQAIAQRILSLPTKSKVHNGMPFLDINTVKERSDIVAIVEPHTTLRPFGHKYRGLCPFHSERHASFFVWPEDNHYYCFGCGTHGSVLDFVMAMHGLNITDGVHFLADQAGLHWPEAPKNKERWSVDL